MKERVVNVYDPPPAAVPDSAKYLAAMTYRASREAKALRLKRWTFALAVLGLSWGTLMTWDNLRIAGKLVEIAQYKPVYRVEQAMDGHQRLVLLDNTLTVSRGARINAVMWFVRWQRQIGTDPVVLAKDRAAARARLIGGAERKWDALMAGDLNPAEGWTRDVSDVRVQERESDPKTGMSAFYVVWTETVYRDFKPRSKTLMSAAVVTVDGPSRDGALDGVSISGFSEPSGTPLKTEMKEPPKPHPAPHTVFETTEPQP
jgi:type IV secretory pathway TrbF-like protein